jgi:hypothetical protein
LGPFRDFPRYRHRLCPDRDDDFFLRFGSHGFFDNRFFRFERLQDFVFCGQVLRRRNCRFGDRLGHSLRFGRG